MTKEPLSPVAASSTTTVIIKKVTNVKKNKKTLKKGKTFKFKRKQLP